MPSIATSPLLIRSNPAIQEEISAVGPAGKIEFRIPGPSRFWPYHLGEEPTPDISV